MASRPNQRIWLDFVLPDGKELGALDYIRTAVPKAIFPAYKKQVMALVAETRRDLFRRLGRKGGKFSVVTKSGAFTLRNTRGLTKGGTNPEHTEMAIQIQIARFDQWARGMEEGIPPHKIPGPGSTREFLKQTGREKAPYARTVNGPPAKHYQGGWWQPFGPRFASSLYPIKHPGVSPGRYDFVRQETEKLNERIGELLASQGVKPAVGPGFVTGGSADRGAAARSGLRRRYSTARLDRSKREPVAVGSGFARIRQQLDAKPKPARRPRQPKIRAGDRGSTATYEKHGFSDLMVETRQKFERQFGSESPHLQQLNSFHRDLHKLQLASSEAYHQRLRKELADADLAVPDWLAPGAAPAAASAGALAKSKPVRAPHEAKRPKAAKPTKAATERASKTTTKRVKDPMKEGIKALQELGFSKNELGMIAPHELAVLAAEGPVILARKKAGASREELTAMLSRMSLNRQKAAELEAARQGQGDHRKKK